MCFCPRCACEKRNSSHPVQLLIRSFAQTQLENRKSVKIKNQTILRRPANQFGHRVKVITAIGPRKTASCMKISPQSHTAYKMSQFGHKRLAKRSIVGTRVCAPGRDKLYYSGIIQKVKTPPISINDKNNCITLTADTKYTVRFDIGQTMIGTAEYLASELIGPGFQNVMNVNLAPGQRIFITYNGRESAAEVLSHDFAKDEVCVRIPANGYEVSACLLFLLRFRLCLL